MTYIPNAYINGSGMIIVVYCKTHDKYFDTSRGYNKHIKTLHSMQFVQEKSI